MKPSKLIILGFLLFLPLYAHAKAKYSTVELIDMAESGDPDAQFKLGYRYLMDEEYSYNREEGLKWLKLSAENGNIFAQHNLGSIFFEGRIVEKDTDEATVWYTKAAESGFSFSQFLLITLLKDKKPKEAYAWAYVLSQDTNDGWREHGRTLVDEMEKSIDQNEISNFRLFAKDFYNIHLNIKE